MSSTHFAAAAAICLETLQLFAVCTVHLKAGAAAKAILLRNLTGC